MEQKSRGNLSYYNFIESSGWDPSVAFSRFERSKEVYDHFVGLSDNVSIVPHAPYSVSEPLWKLIRPFFDNKVVSIHNQETTFEDDFFRHGTGDFVRMFEKMNIDNSFFIPFKTSSLQTYFQQLSGAASVLLVHNTFIKEEDIAFLQKSGLHQLVSFCICINANLYIENAKPPLEMLIHSGFNITLGTDSFASNDSLNILDEMKSIQQYFPFVPLEQMLTWATSNGARALMLDGQLGCFVKGKKPGIALIENTSGLKLIPGSTSRRVL